MSSQSASRPAEPTIGRSSVTPSDGDQATEVSSNDAAPCRDPVFFDPNIYLPADCSGGLIDRLWSMAFSDLHIRRDALRKLEQALEILAANLARLAARQADGLLVSLNKAKIDVASRYKPELVNYRRLRNLLDVMEAQGIISVHKGGDRRIKIETEQGPEWVRETTVIRLHRFSDELAALNHAGAVQHRRGTERIVLRGAEGSSEYGETDQTTRLRCEVLAINEHMTRHPVDYSSSLPIDRSATVLSRIFNHSFDQGGRLYGHYAQNLRKDQRQYLTIDSEPLADLDFEAMHYWLLHAEAGVTPLTLRDPFAIPGFEDHRKLIKTAAYAILNASRRLKNYPTGLNELAPTGMPWHDVEAAVLANLPIISSHAYSGIGLTLQRRESDILVRVLAELILADIGFLPMHDGIMVPASHAALTHSIMLRVYREATGHSINITNKSAPVITINREAA